MMQIIGLESEFIQSRLLFPNLSELDLSMNLLHNLTSDIGEQLNLRVLSLRGNRYLREVSFIFCFFLVWVVFFEILITL